MNAAAARPWTVSDNVRQMRHNVLAGLLPSLSPAEMVWIDAVMPPGNGRKRWPA